MVHTKFNFIDLGGSRVNLVSDALGVKYESENYLLDFLELMFLDAIFLEVNLRRITGGTVTIELFNVTDVVVVDSIALAAATFRNRSSVNLAGKLIKAKEYRIRWNVTTAGAPASVFDADPVKLVVIDND